MTTTARAGRLWVGETGARDPWVMTPRRYPYVFDTPEGHLAFTVELPDGLGRRSRRPDLFRCELNGERISTAEVLRLVHAYGLAVPPERLP